MHFNEIFQLCHIPASLLHGDFRKIHWVTWHWDAHVETFSILKVKNTEKGYLNIR